MINEPLFFKHDYHARNDRKMVALILDHKSAGIGIFWTVLEMIYEENGRLEYDDLTISMVVKDLNEDIELVRLVIKNCIKKYHLFKEEGGKIISNRASNQLYNRQRISEVRAQAGKAGASAKQVSGKSQASAKQVSGKSQASAKQVSGKSQASAKQTEAIDQQNSQKRREEKRRDNTVLDRETEKLENLDSEKPPPAEAPVLELSPGAENSVPGHDLRIGNLENEIGGNQIQFELLCARTLVAADVAREVLHDCHLWHEKNEKYPVGRKAAYASFESFLRNKKYHPNGTESIAPEGGRRKVGQRQRGGGVEHLKEWSLGAIVDRQGGD